MIRRFSMIGAREACESVVDAPFPPLRIPMDPLAGRRTIGDFKPPRSGVYESPGTFVGWARDWRYDTARGILLDAKGRIIRDSVNTSILPRDHRGAAAGIQRGDAVLLDGPATVLRTQSDNFYHTMIDNLPRLLLFEKVGYEGALEILVPNGLNAAEEFWLPKLMPPGADIRLLEGPDDCFRIRRFAYASPFTERFRGVVSPAYAHRIRKEAFGPAEVPAGRSRILISRSPGSKGGRLIVNEGELLEALKPWGFERRVLEEYPIGEQVRLFRNAEMVVGAHGAGLSNMLFIEKDATILELFPDDFVIPHYFFLAASLGLDYRFAFPLRRSERIAGNGRRKRHSDFRADVGAVRAQVKEILG